MRHCSIKDIRRTYLPILFLSVIGILLGSIVSLIFVINPTPAYENMSESTVTVDSIKYISSYRGGGHYELKTTDGEFYNLSGEFTVSDFCDKLPLGTEIQIKWYSKTWFFQKELYIEEIKLQNELICVYTNNDKSAMIFGFLIGGICIAMGIGGIILYLGFVNGEIARLSKKNRK